MTEPMIKRAARSGGRVGRGFVTGLAQATSIVGLHPVRPVPTQRTPAQALGGDWEKIGGDFQRAMAKATAGDKR